VWVCGSEFLFCVGQFGEGLWGVSLSCVWESLVWVCGTECVLCVGEFGLGLWKWVCALCGQFL